VRPTTTSTPTPSSKKRRKNASLPLRDSATLRTGLVFYPPTGCLVSVTPITSVEPRRCGWLSTAWRTAYPAGSPGSTQQPIKLSGR
jgi:hypothetical protein